MTSTTITVTTTYFLTRNRQAPRIRATGPAGTVWTEQHAEAITATAHQEALTNYLALHGQHDAIMSAAAVTPGGNGYAFTLDTTTETQR